MKMSEQNKLNVSNTESKFSSASVTATSSTDGTNKMPDWWPFHKPDWSACSSGSAKGIGAGTMKKDDIKL